MSTETNQSAGTVKAKAIVALAVIVLAGMFWWSVSNSPQTTLAPPPTREAPATAPAPAAQPEPAQPVLELGDWSWSPSASDRYVEARGQVTNISGETMENVAAVVTFLADDDTFITSEDALIDFNPILAGQTSPWSLLATRNPAMSKARVEFKTLFGAKLEHRVK